MIKRTRRMAGFLFSAAVLAAVSAHAAEVLVPLDQAKAISLPEAASGVAIGNPNIAAVSVQHDRLLFITGRAYGTTNLVVVNGAGRPILETRLTVVPDETNTVMVTKGALTQRFDCTPLCRRRPDLSDDADSFNQEQSKITARSGGEGE
jgi:Flp pilus assembly secretin CpaC